MGSFKPARVALVVDSDEVTQGLAKVAKAGAAGAYEACPRGETGRLAESIDWDVEPGRAAFFYGVDYGGFPEYGTRYQPAQAFMRGAGVDAAIRAAR